MYQYQDIDYRLVRSVRKTASIYVERDGQVSVRVPKDTSMERVERILEAKRRWIYKSLAEWRLLNSSRTTRQYVNGEGFLYLGRSYRLKLVERQDEALVLKNGFFCLRINGGNAQEKFIEYYKVKGQDILPRRVHYFARRLGVEVKGVRVLELGTHWGSCSNRRMLNFHWKTMMAPLAVIDYVVAHELAHLRHKRHTKAFWAEIDKLVPAYREHREWLRLHGAGMSI